MNPLQLLLEGNDLVLDVTLLALRVFTGLAFIQHGLPKLRQLQPWAKMLHMPVWLCALSAASMVLGGVGLIVGFLTAASALAIAGSMAYAVVFLAGHGASFIPPEPFELPAGDYMGSIGPGEPASWEKAALYVLICLLLVGAGPGGYSLDRLWLLPLLGGG